MNNNMDNNNNNNMDNNNDKKELRNLLDKAATDFSVNGFSDAELSATKELLRKLDPVAGGPVPRPIAYFIGDQFKFGQPDRLEDDILQFQVSGLDGTVILKIDKDGNLFM